MRKVLVLQRILPHYRVPLFQQLQHRLKQESIELILQYGQEQSGQVPVTVQFHETWAHYRKNHYLSSRVKTPVIQPIPWGELKTTDLVIVEQASRLLSNYLLAASKGIGYKMALWGHGKNFQPSNSSAMGELVKRKMNRVADHWFAYTGRSVAELRRQSIPLEKITNLENSIETNYITARLKSLDRQRLEQLKREIGLGPGPVAIFCGGMDERKNIPFLLSALLEIRAKVANFQMIFIGDGPQKALVEKFAESHVWCFDFGKITSADRVDYFAVSDVALMPGALGLVIVDCLATQTPLITTNIPNHNPEIDYLVDGENAVFSQPDVNAYTSACVSVLTDPTKVESLKMGCIGPANRYTLENMVSNFAEGIVKALK